jgi:methylornithine synthase
MQLDTILQKATAEQPLDRSEILQLLALKDAADQAKVFAAARIIREKHFGNKIFLYGFIYFSTYCKNNCSFCYYRKTNDESPRYRKSIDETVKIAGELAASGVHLIDLTMGEDPFFHAAANYQQLSKLVRAVKKASGLPVMVSPGLLPARGLYELKTAGADWYAVYQETHNPGLYAGLRLQQDYDDRIEAKVKAKKLGLFIEEGILLGVGEEPDDIVDSILTMQQLAVHQARVMSLVPQGGTPLAGHPAPPESRELLTIAVMRLVLGNVLIPASLDIEGIAGLKRRLEAGANVVTSIIPPATGLAGVSQSSLDIEEGFRTVAGVSKILNDLQLHAAAPQDYISWLQARKKVPQHKAGLQEGDVINENRHCRRSAAGN